MAAAGCRPISSAWRKRRQVDEPQTLQIYASGCSGNVTAGKYNAGAVGNRPVLAERIYVAMKEAWKHAKKQPLEKIGFRSVPLKLEARSGKGFSEAELMDRLKNDPRPFGQCLAALGLSWRKRVEAGEPIDLPVLDFGPAYSRLCPRSLMSNFNYWPRNCGPMRLSWSRATASAARGIFRSSAPGKKTTRTCTIGAGSTPVQRRACKMLWREH